MSSYDFFSNPYYNNRRNKNTNINVLCKLLNTWIDDMKEYGDDIIPPNAKFLYTATGIPAQTFDNNFANLYGVIFCAKNFVIEDIKNSITASLLPPQTPIEAIKRITSIQPDDIDSNDPRKTCIDFAVRHLPFSFWKEALLPIRPILLKDLPNYGESANDLFYACFVSQCQYLFYHWVVNNHDHSCIEQDLLYMQRAIKLLPHIFSA